MVLLIYWSIFDSVFVVLLKRNLAKLYGKRKCIDFEVHLTCYRGRKVLIFYTTRGESGKLHAIVSLSLQSHAYASLPLSPLVTHYVFHHMLWESVNFPEKSLLPFFSTFLQIFTTSQLGLTFKVHICSIIRL